MPNLGYVSTLNINGNELSLKDSALTSIVDNLREIIEEIIEAIGANNGDISDRINNLHERSFDALIKISSQNDSEIASIEDGMYKIQYVTITGEGDDATETLDNSAILIQKGTAQYLYKDGKLSSRTKINNTWGNWTTFEGGVTSVNGMTGAVTLNIPDAQIQSDWNQTTTTAKDYIKNKPDIITISGESNKVKTINFGGGSNIDWDGGNDSHIKINSEVISLNTNTVFGGAYYNNKEIAVKDDIKVTSVNGMTGAVTITHPVTSVNGMTGAVALDIPSEIITGQIVGRMHRDNVSGTGSLTITGASGEGFSPTGITTAGKYIVVVYSWSDTKTVGYNISFGDNNYTLSTTDGTISDKRELTVSAGALWSGSVTTAVNAGTTIIVEIYKAEKITPALSVGVVALTNLYNDLDGKPTISNSTSSTSATDIASSRAVKLAYDHGGVQSVNGMTGAVTITIPEGQLSNNYATATGTNSELLLASGDTYETAFGKLEKEILDNELIAAAGMNDLNDQIANITHPVTSVNGMTGAVVINVPVTSVNGMTGAVTITHPVTSVNGKTGAVTGLAPIASPGFTGTPTAPTPTAGTNNTQIATTAFVQTAVSQFGNAMEFKGSVGTGGTYTSSTFPAASTDNKGWTVKVITDGTYQGVAAKEGDTLISDGTTWVLIPSGDEPSGTVTNVGLTMPTGFTVSNTPITSSGTLSVTMTDGYIIPTTTQSQTWTNKVTSVNGMTGVVTGLAPIASPGFTGTPTAPTPTSGTNNTQIATTAFVQDAIDANKIRANWTATNPTSYAYIQNKPLIEQNGNTRLIINAIASGNNNLTYIKYDRSNSADAIIMCSYNGFYVGTQNTGLYKNSIAYESEQEFLNIDFTKNSSTDFRMQLSSIERSGTKSLVKTVAFLEDLNNIKTCPIEEFNNNLYYKKSNNQYYPVSDPDLSTQPSILPNRFGQFNMFEVLMPIYGNKNVVDGELVSDEYIIIYSNDDEKFLVFRVGDIIYNNSVILEAHLVGDNIYSSVSIIKTGEFYKVYPQVPIDAYKNNFNYLYIKYYNSKYKSYNDGKSNDTYDFAEYDVNQYLTITSLEDNNNIIFKYTPNIGPYATIFVSSNDGLTWEEKVNSDEGIILSTLNAGEKLLLKGSNFQTYGGANTIASSGKFNISGNIMALVGLDNFANSSFTYHEQFYKLFAGSKVVDASKLILPKFVDDGCYSFMFKDCIYLEKAPQLPATVLTNTCYEGLFAGCSSLNSIICLASNFESPNYASTHEWLTGVSNNGLFICNPDMIHSYYVENIEYKEFNHPYGNSTVPAGWDIQVYNTDTLIRYDDVNQ